MDQKGSAMTSAKSTKALDLFVKLMTWFGISLPVCYVASIAASDLSNFLARQDFIGWMADYASVFSVPWEVLATLVVILRWRDLTQRFWILYIANGFLAYISLPIYEMHFGIHF
jgi:hypothetical protein